jgi:flagellar biosynthesis/type III secretory pathway protein FliH
LGQIKLAADDAIGRGGCVIETDFGDIDARIDQQLKVIGAAIRKETDRES